MAAASSETGIVTAGINVARSVLETQARAVQSAEQDVARLTAVLEQAQVVLRDHTLRAPMRGTILAMDAEVGHIVDQATPLLTLADLSTLVVEADVDESYATQIAPSQNSVMQFAGETDTRDGHVSFVSRLVDVETGGLSVRLGFDDPVVAPVGLWAQTSEAARRYMAFFPTALDVAPRSAPPIPAKVSGEDERRGEGDLGGRIARRAVSRRRRLPCGISRTLFRHLPAREYNETKGQERQSRPRQERREPVAHHRAEREIGRRSKKPQAGNTGHAAGQGQQRRDQHGPGVLSGVPADAMHDVVDDGHQRRDRDPTRKPATAARPIVTKGCAATDSSSCTSAARPLLAA